MRLVSVSSTATTESSAIAAEALSSIAVARLAVEPSIGSVVALGGLERQFRDVGLAFGTLEPER